MKQKTPVIFVSVVPLCIIELKINHSSLMEFEICHLTSIFLQE